MRIQLIWNKFLEAAIGRRLPRKCIFPLKPVLPVPPGAYPRYIAAGEFPNAARKAWTGNSNGFVNVEIYLPASAKNQTVQFRWNASADTGIASVGTYIDDVEVVGNYSCRQIFSGSKSRSDYDSNVIWHINGSTNEFSSTVFGLATGGSMPKQFTP